MSTNNKKTHSSDIVVSFVDADLFLSDLEGLADAVALCGEGVERLGLNGNELAFHALQTAIQGPARLLPTPL
ncbi:MAG TPA: hypothetical protein VHL31_12330 [Geminicoccus sp.]|uniref:hypothetical protein n=1 Tax=Geminicoccus sp. TaxID=2024832 RepID=UPI002E3240C5|nr:hypothetical protein [Geminicoccus sp.]HEX2527068.1 hypothetical protein [Geminicoccus sp.]